FWAAGMGHFVPRSRDYTRVFAPRPHPSAAVQTTPLAANEPRQPGIAARMATQCTITAQDRRARRAHATAGLSPRRPGTRPTRLAESHPRRDVLLVAANEGDYGAAALRRSRRPQQHDARHVPIGPSVLIVTRLHASLAHPLLR